RFGDCTRAPLGLVRAKDMPDLLSHAGSYKEYTLHSEANPTAAVHFSSRQVREMQCVADARFAPDGRPGAGNIGTPPARKRFAHRLLGRTRTACIIRLTVTCARLFDLGQSMA